MKLLRVLIFILVPLNGFSQLAGKVVSIEDGDTFTMLIEGNKQVKVRLHGIDCPEKDQDYGDAAKKYLIVLLRVTNDSVRVDVKKKDRYGLTIGIAYSGKTNINESLLEHGLAWHDKRHDSNPKWSLMEEGARNMEINLWSKPNAVPPWEWREKKKRKN